MIGVIRVVQLGIKVYIFKGADQFNNLAVPMVAPDGKIATVSSAELAAQQQANKLETQRQREREVAEAVTMIIVGAPLYLYHWKTIQKENKK